MTDTTYDTYDLGNIPVSTFPEKQIFISKLSKSLNLFLSVQFTIFSKPFSFNYQFEFELFEFSLLLLAPYSLFKSFVILGNEFWLWLP